MWAGSLTHGVLFPLALLPMPSWTGQASLSEQMSRRVRALFGAMNFWAIIMYNLVSLNSLEFTELVARRLLLTGEGWGCGHRKCQAFTLRTVTS